LSLLKFYEYAGKKASQSAHAALYCVLMRKLWFLLSFSFVFLSIALARPHFYEAGIYISYLKAFLADGDLNIINHVSEDMGWLATWTFFHPARHSEIQTPALAFFHQIAVEIGKVFSLLPHQRSQELPFILAGCSLSFLSLCSSFWLTRLIALEIGTQLTLSRAACFYFGTALLYFSFFSTTVLDISVLPFLSFLVLSFIRSKKGIATHDPWTVGIAGAILVISRATYYPLVIYFLWVMARSRPDGHVRFSLRLLTPFLLLLACDHLNQLQKFGEWLFSHSPTALLIDLSPWRMARSLYTGYLAPGGVFFVNPPFLVGLLGLGALFQRLFQRGVLNRLDIGILAIWVLSTLMRSLPFNFGHISEDHLPGRRCIEAAPFLILGFTFAVENLAIPKTSKAALGVLACTWHIALLLGHHLVDQFMGTYRYPLHLFPPQSEWPAISIQIQSRLSEQLQEAFYATPILLVYSLVLTLLLTWTIKKAGSLGTFRALSFCWGAFFALLTISNLVLAPRKIERLRHAGFYESRVIGKGAEIYLVDFAFDIFKTIRTTGDRATQERIASVMPTYYERMRAQVVHSTPWFEEQLRRQSPDLSFFIRRDGR
jgi:hypothetical protein